MAIAALFLSPACKKPTPFGSELLEGEYGDFEFTDTISVKCTLLREDSLITSDKAAASAHFLCGSVNDPILGKYTSDIYALMQSETLNPSFADSIRFDSVVLYLNYAPAGVYGDTLQQQTLRVIRLAETLKSDQTYYSRSTLQEGAELGRVDYFYPKPTTYDSLYDGNEGAFLRVRLDDNFGKELLGLDSLDWATDSSFYAKFRGLKIVSATSGATPGAMLAFNLNSSALSRMTIYYTQDDTLHKRYSFFFKNANKFTHFEHDYAGTAIPSHLGQPVDDRLYVHGMEGLRLKVEFPYANSFNQIAVNKAQLVLTTADNDIWLKPASQLVFTESVGDTTYAFTSDVLAALGTTGTGSLAAFGGFPEKELVNGNLVITRYRMTLSEKFQHMVDDDAAPNIKHRTVYINVQPRVRSAQRSILYGPQSTSFPAKLELKYTKVR